MERQPGLNAGDSLLAVTTLSFDISVLELLLPLCVGAHVVIASRAQAMDGKALRDLIERHRINVMQATPASWKLLIDAMWQGYPSFKALVGGEALSPVLASQLLQRAGEVWNMYGPTETTVWSTCWKVDDPQKGVFIGRPIANTRIHVLDKQRQLCPPGAYGEIWISGAGVTLGYLNRPELTSARYLTDPTGPGTMYGTGDRGRWTAEGLLEHAGRFDHQVKVRGYRIELGEIESILSTHPGVLRAVVVAREDLAGDKKIVAYLVGSAEQLSAPSLRDHVRQRLPDYMIPQQFVRVDAIPVLPNGKIDRAALTTGVHDMIDTPRAPEPAASMTPMESMLAATWRDLLAVEDVHRRDTFFGLGGHSLLVMQVIARMKEQTGKEIEVRHFIFDSFEQIAKAYEDAPVVAPIPQEPEGLGRILRVFRRLR
jgi:acyl-coenzyme A synthetase/AMP-(fatty) acid ligase